MLLKPEIKLDRVTDITCEMLARRGIDSLLLDVDNTLSTHHGMVLTDGLAEWIDKMKSKGIKLLVLSNSKKERVEPFAEKIGLDFISLALKPLPSGYIRGMKRLGSGKNNTAIVGDQIFTDVLGGNAAGLHTVLLTPIKLETSLRFRFKRALERVVYKLYRIKTTEE